MTAVTLTLVRLRTGPTVVKPNVESLGHDRAHQDAGGPDPCGLHAEARYLARPRPSREVKGSATVGGRHGSGAPTGRRDAASIPRFVATVNSRRCLIGHELLDLG